PRMRPWGRPAASRRAFAPRVGRGRPSGGNRVRLSPVASDRAERKGCYLRTEPPHSAAVAAVGYGAVGPRGVGSRHLKAVRTRGGIVTVLCHTSRGGPWHPDARRV